MVTTLPRRILPLVLGFAVSAVIVSAPAASAEQGGPGAIPPSWNGQPTQPWTAVRLRAEIFAGSMRAADEAMARMIAAGRAEAAARLGVFLELAEPGAGLMAGSNIGINPYRAYQEVLLTGPDPNDVRDVAVLLARKGFLILDR